LAGWPALAQLGSGDDDTLAGTTGEPGVPVTEFATIAEPTSAQAIYRLVT